VQKTNNKEQTFMIDPQITTSPLETFAPSEVFFSARRCHIAQSSTTAVSVNKHSQKGPLRAKGA
jgi:hypothetical protein